MLRNGVMMDGRAVGVSMNGGMDGWMSRYSAPREYSTMKISSGVIRSRSGGGSGDVVVRGTPCAW